MATDSVLRIVIVDDHAVVRDGLRQVVSAYADMEVVAEAADGEEALRCVLRYRPSVVLMDISMPGWSGITTTQKVIEAVPSTRVIGVSRHVDLGIVRGMLGAGAAGYVLKQRPTRGLIEAIRIVAGGGTYIDSEIGDQGASGVSPTSDEPADDQHAPGLSDAETGVLRHLAEAHSYQEIAAAMSLSVADVATLRSAAMRKAGLASRIELMAYARKRRWLRP
jgi:two-component system response regulator NreC